MRFLRDPALSTRLPSGQVVGLDLDSLPLRQRQLGLKKSTDSLHIRDALKLLDVLVGSGHDNSVFRYAGFSALEAATGKTGWPDEDVHAFRAFMKNAALGWLSDAVQELPVAPDAYTFQPVLPDGIFHSPLARAVAGLRMDKAPAAQWLSTIRNLGKQGIAQEEIEWNWAIAWIENQQGKLSKQAVLERIQPSVPRIVAGHETRIAFDPRLAFEFCNEPPKLGCGLSRIKNLRVANNHYRNRTLGYRIVEGEAADLLGEKRCWILLDHRGRPIPDSLGRMLYPRVPNAVFQACVHAANHYKDYGSVLPDAAWHVWVLAGGTDYREWLLVMPDFVPVYDGPHFKTPNVLCHVRTTRRVTTEGKRILFVEEVQSDWHQNGRELGYRDNIAEDDGLPPEAPFAKTWHELAMKTMLYIAAREGCDGLAWTSGIMQAARFPGAMPGIGAFYDDVLARFMAKVARGWESQLEHAHIEAPRGQFYLRRELSRWWVCHPNGKAALSPGYVDEESAWAWLLEQPETVRDAHAVPVVWFDGDTARHIVASGVPLYGYRIMQGSAT